MDFSRLALLEAVFIELLKAVFGLISCVHTKLSLTVKGVYIITVLINLFDSLILGYSSFRSTISVSLLLLSTYFCIERQYLIISIDKVINYKQMNRITLVGTLNFIILK